MPHLYTSRSLTELLSLADESVTTLQSHPASVSSGIEDVNDPLSWPLWADWFARWVKGSRALPTPHVGDAVHDQILHT